MNNLRCIILFFFVLMLGEISCQVINIESKRFLNDTSGWIGRMDNYFQLTQNTQQIISLGNNVHMQYSHHEHKFLILNDINFIKAGSTDFVNSGYQHFRYSYKIRKWITWESFAQGQYNAIMKIQLRLLGGTGPRFRIVKREDFKLYAACLYMYEYEEIILPRTYTTTNRLSAYATFTWTLTDNVEFSSTTFYQPALNDLSDYRLAGDGAFEFSINKRISLKINYNFLYDTKQPPGVPNFIYSVRNALGFKF
jgi:putative salt-induced outer membrane protein YdiY